MTALQNDRAQRRRVLMAFRKIKIIRAHLNYAGLQELLDDGIPDLGGSTCTTITTTTTIHLYTKLTFPLRWVAETRCSHPHPCIHTYACTPIFMLFQVAELKRINKIIQEKEFYALKSLKIPVKANSLLAEVLQQEQCEDECASASVATTRAAMLGTRSVSSCSEYESDSEMHVGYISIDRILRDTRTKKEAKRFLDSMQKDLANIREKSNSYKSSLDEVAAVLRDPRFQPLARHEGGCSGADWGISWWRILLFGTLLLVGIPFFVYVILNFQNK